MVRWLITLALVAQVAPALAQEKCGISRLTRGHLSVSVFMKQHGDETPFADHVSYTSRSSDGALELRAPYTMDQSGLLIPYMLFIQTLPNLPPEQKSPERIKWRFNAEDWATFPYRYTYPDQRGNFSYKIAQLGSGALSFQTEWLDRLRQGGRFTVMRLLEDGQEVAMGSVDYPTNEIIADVFDEARNQALARLAPCGPPAASVPAAPRN
ncbi:hypothetical protein [Sphingopyxis sp.]|jgi:hypothetical protein|uniref:hypothetical protein n=1 Tax=Sphingopyxis sp. TaxID=1908224 RepID=UPI002E06B726|nr:hypothetical protein [Sphingopyxis sp.]